ncbi:MAG: hypothetical protein JNJ80_15680, partial [Gemmatimonadetes bacterium]|nr:hypothetical protein [Gemmatimonadota bacterium]
DVGPRLQWAIRWASRRATAKRNRQFPEADRIRTLLVNHQFDVRDRRDGSAELIDRGA